MRTLLLLTFSVLTCTLCAQTTTQSFTLQFDTGSAVSDSASMQKFSKFLHWLNTHPESVSEIQLYGFADTTGTTSANMQLSADRVAYVQEQISLLSPNYAGEINTRAYGEKMQNSTLIPWQQRVVYVEVTKVQKTLTSKGKTATSAEVMAMLETLGPKWQHFMLDPTRDTIICGTEGTRIFIPAYCFDVLSVDAQRGVAISLKEYYTYSDLLLGGMSTTSGQELLETGGSINLTARVNNKEVFPKFNKAITVFFDGKRRRDGFEFFTGQRSNNGFVNWRLGTEGMIGLFEIDRVHLLSRSYFTKEARVMDCPYLFCGLREDLDWLFGQSGQMKYRTYRTTDWRAYRAYIDSMEVAFNAYGYSDLVKKINAWNSKAKTSYDYVVSTSKMGLMNCDRFLKLPPEQQTQVLAYETAATGAVAFLAFHNYNAMMALNYFTEDQIGFTNVGINEPCTLVMIKMIDNEIYLFKKQIETTDAQGIRPVYRKVSRAQLSEELDLVNNLQPA